MVGLRGGFAVLVLLAGACGDSPGKSGPDRNTGATGGSVELAAGTQAIAGIGGTGGAGSGPTGGTSVQRVDGGGATAGTDSAQDAAVPPLPVPGMLPEGWSQLTPWIDSVSGSMIPASEPAVALSPDGEGHVIMHYSPATGRGIIVSRIDAQGRWGTTQTVAADSSAYELAIAIDAADRGVAIGASEQAQLEWYAREPAADWTYGGTVGEPATHKTTEPQLALGADGSAFAIWTQCNGDETAQVLAARFDGASWSDPHVLDASSYCMFVFPSIAADDHGHAIAVWRATQSHDATDDHSAASYFDGASWSAAENISGSRRPQSYPQVAMDSAGHAIALMAFDVLHAAQFTPEDGWGAPEPIGRDSAQIATPNLKADGTGRILAVWTELLPDSGSRLFARWHLPDEGWAPTELISHPLGRAGLFGLAVNDAGQAVVIWSANKPTDSMTEVIWANRFEPAGGWGEPLILEEGGMANLGRRWSTAINANGLALFAWLHYPKSGSAELHALTSAP